MVKQRNKEQQREEEGERFGPATVLLSGKIFMVGTRYTAVKLYRGIEGIPQYRDGPTERGCSEERKKDPKDKKKKRKVETS